MLLRFKHLCVSFGGSFYAFFCNPLFWITSAFEKCTWVMVLGDIVSYVVVGSFKSLWLKYQLYIKDRFARSRNNVHVDEGIGQSVFSDREVWACLYPCLGSGNKDRWLALRPDLTRRLARPSRAQTNRGSCWQRQQIKVVAWLVNPARSLGLLLRFFSSLSGPEPVSYTHLTLPTKA